MRDGDSAERRQSEPLVPNVMDIEEVRRIRELLSLNDGPMDLWLASEPPTIWSISLAQQAYYYQELLTEPPITRGDRLL